MRFSKNWQISLKNKLGLRPRRVNLAWTPKGHCSDLMESLGALSKNSSTFGMKTHVNMVISKKTTFEPHM